jgi:hypothetical protein
VSLGIENSAEDVDILIETLGKIAVPNPRSPDRTSATGTTVLTMSEAQRQMNDFVMAAAKRVYFTDSV